MLFKSMFVAVLFVQVMSLTPQESIKQTLETCTKSSGVDPVIQSNAFQGKIVDDANLKKFVDCFFVKENYYDKDGSVDWKLARSKVEYLTFIPNENKQKTIDDCEKKDYIGKTNEETAFLNFQCYLGLI